LWTTVERLWMALLRCPSAWYNRQTTKLRQMRVIRRMRDGRDVGVEVSPSYTRQCEPFRPANQRVLRTQDVDNLWTDRPWRAVIHGRKTHLTRSRPPA
jgi:hypothetical protein